MGVPLDSCTYELIIERQSRNSYRVTWNLREASSTRRHHPFLNGPVKQVRQKIRKQQNNGKRGSGRRATSTAARVELLDLGLSEVRVSIGKCRISEVAPRAHHVRTVAGG